MASPFSVTSSRQHELDLHNPALCELLPVRDILDIVVVTTSGSFVAGYALSGDHSYYHTEEMRNRAKESFEAVLRTGRKREEAEHVIADRRQRVLHRMTRMNGARGMVETLAQKRFFIGSLPCMAEENKREIDILTLNSADLLPIETPWQGTPHTRHILLETRQRQLIPFSPFDSSLNNANMLIMASSGGGKTFMAQMFLLMLGRSLSEWPQSCLLRQSRQSVPWATPRVRPNPSFETAFLFLPHGREVVGAKTGGCTRTLSAPSVRGGSSHQSLPSSCLFSFPASPWTARASNRAKISTTFRRSSSESRNQCASWG